MTGITSERLFVLSMYTIIRVKTGLSNLFLNENLNDLVCMIVTWTFFSAFCP